MGNCVNKKNEIITMRIENIDININKDSSKSEIDIKYSLEIRNNKNLIKLKSNKLPFSSPYSNDISKIFNLSDDNNNIFREVVE